MLRSVFCDEASRKADERDSSPSLRSAQTTPQHLCDRVLEQIANQLMA